MRLLLDSHVVLWWLGNDPELGDPARAAIAAEESSVFVSAASAWELSIKKALGKLDAPDDLESQLAAHRFEPLPVAIAHAWTAGALPRHHDDPFDRMLVAQATTEELTIVTRDPRISRYGVPTLGA